MRSLSFTSLRLEAKWRRYVNAGLAVGLTMGSVAVPFALLDGYLQRRAEIDELCLDLDRFGQRSSSTEIRRKTAEPESEVPSGIFAADLAAAGAHIQVTLRNLGTELGTEEVRIESVRVLPPLSQGGTTAVRASASLTAPATRIFDVVNLLEAASPSIVIDSLRIVSRSDANAARIGSPSGPSFTRGEVTLALRVYAPSKNEDVRPPKPAEKRASGEDRLP